MKTWVITNQLFVSWDIKFAYHPVPKWYTRYYLNYPWETEWYLYYINANISLEELKKDILKKDYVTIIEWSPDNLYQCKCFVNSKEINFNWKIQYST